MARTKDEILSVLDNYVGIDKIKDEIHNYVNRVEMEKMISGKTPQLYERFIFKGNRGTGKSTIARLMGELFASLGLLSTGHFVECSRGHFVAESRGETKIKSNSLIDSAMGGVLFIDNVNTLVQGDDDILGREAFETLLYRMIQDYGKFLCIFSGCDKEISMFTNSLPGLTGKFSKIFEFENIASNSSSNKMIIKIDGVTHQGLVRDDNQDKILIDNLILDTGGVEFSAQIDVDTKFICAVADGMGGVAGGAFASQIVTENAANLSWATAKDWTTNVNNEVINKGITNNLSGMGSTFVGMIWENNKVWMINVGDSRLYRFRGDVLKQLSADHSLREYYNDQTLASNVVTNIFGGNASTYSDTKELSVIENDLYLLCSDGICDMISDEQIEQLLKVGASAQQFVDAANLAGGADNISVILIRTYVESL